METILSFFSDLLLITFGLIVLVGWIVAMVMVGIEVYDLFTERTKEDEEEHLE